MYRMKTDAWYVERTVFLVAGCVNGLSIVLVLLHSSYWLILTGFVSVNLIVFAAGGFCPSAALFSRMGMKARLARESKRTERLTRGARSVKKAPGS